ncbi:MAG: prepilin-type N-terminal cleavage/methylation domain-containing protein, partial [Elusimicrobia bacterium]|nr:prepilin-type N-terminal cleavage/methylation domain-containing protein [Elusimicrobiota bacterium]
MRTNNRGFSLIEVVLATLILGIVVAALLNVQFFMGTQSVDIKDKTFANQKAMQILEELRSRVAGAESSDVAMLDDFDDGSLYKSVLTTDTDTTDPASPISGNRAECKAWRYLRQIAVTKLPNEPYARKVHVTIYKAGCPDSSKPAATLTESMSILKTIKSEYVPTQVMDIYVLALENVPGWWSALPLMRPIFESLIQDLQDRNPGLELRTHWITRLSFGRDPYYTPYIND